MSWRLMRTGLTVARQTREQTRKMKTRRGGGGSWCFQEGERSRGGRVPEALPAAAAQCFGCGGAGGQASGGPPLLSYSFLHPPLPPSFQSLREDAFSAAASSANPQPQDWSWTSLDWFQLALTGPDWSRPVQTGPDWSRLVPTGSNWSRLVQTGPDWSRLVQSAALFLMEAVTSDRIIYGQTAAGAV